MRVDSTTLRHRIGEVEAALEREGIGALVVYANGSALGAASKSHGHLRYLCNWDGHNTPSVLVLAPGHAPHLLTPNIFLSFLARELLWFDDLRFVKVPGFAAEIASILGAVGRADGRVAHIGRDEMPVTVWEGLASRLGAVEWVDYTGSLDRSRVVKDELQLTFHRHAASICDAMFQRLTAEIGSGKATFQLQADMEHTARSAGAEYVLTWLTVMPVADYSRFYKEECLRVPQRGDQVLAGIYLIYDGHWGHAIRCGTVGPPSDAHRRVFDVALEMEEAGLAALRPGADLHDVHRAFEAVLHRHYPAGGRHEIFRFRDAHALGHSYEDPVASAPFPQPYDTTAGGAPDEALEVRPGMLFEFHPNLFVRGFAGAAIGDMVAATDGAPEILTTFPRQLIEW